MKTISDADWTRMIGAFVLGMALVENQYHFDAGVFGLYVVSVALIILGFIMNEDFKI